MKKILELEQEGIEMAQRSNIISKTADFLSEEADRLFVILDDINTSYEVKQQTEKQLQQILRKMVGEVDLIMKEESKVVDYTSRFEEMKKLFKQIED